MASPSRLPSTRRPPGAAGGRARPVSMIEPHFSLPAPEATTATTRAMKRRSLLPQLSRASSAECRLDEVTEREKRDPEEAQLGGASDVAVEATRQIDRRAMPPPSSTSRPLSMRIPGSIGLGRAPSTRSHTRTQSKESNASSTGTSNTSRDAVQIPATRAPPTESGLKRTSSTRLPQQPSKPAGLSRTTSIRAPPPPLHTRSSSTTTTATSTAAKRSSISLGRPSAINTSAAPAHQSSTAQSPTSPTRSISEVRPSGRSHMPPPSSRPAFNTFQQHYSPAKSALPKPPLPSSRQPKPTPVIEEDTTITFETAKQQTELLQLSLLHQTSAKTLSQYTQSAHGKLSRKHAKLRKDLDAVRSLEQEQQRLSNLEALQAWCPDPSILVENLQTLGRIHRDITSLTHPSSRYVDLLETFSSWVESAERVLSSSSRSEFITPLPNSWREAHASVSLKVRALQREVAVLPPTPEREDPSKTPASLEVLLGSCRRLVDGLLKELDLVVKLEKEVLGREKVRVDDAVKGLGVIGKGGGGERWVGAWQKA